MLQHLDMSALCLLSAVSAKSIRCQPLIDLAFLQIAGLPTFVKVVEVGPRDGLQNEKVEYKEPNKIFHL